jgi:uncharacterized membrane protein YhaH (DUF805 family)
MEWMILPYRRYAEFTGRSRRKEYWMFVLFNVLVVIAISAIFGRTSYTRVGMFASTWTDVSGPGGILIGLFRLASFIPGLAVAVRRLHDQDKSGWLLLLAFIPFLGWFALFVLMCLDGTRGSNRFGSDPKDPTRADVFS